MSLEGVCPEGKFFVTKFEFEGSFGRSLEGDCHEMEVTPNNELLITFGMIWRELSRACYTVSLQTHPIRREVVVTQNSFKKATLQIG
jgi:hypothetical protein